jgi:hypothetical protein
MIKLDAELQKALSELKEIIEDFNAIKQQCKVTWNKKKSLKK